MPAGRLDTAPLLGVPSRPRQRARVASVELLAADRHDLGMELGPGSPQATHVRVHTADANVQVGCRADVGLSRCGTQERFDDAALTWRDVGIY